MRKKLNNSASVFHSFINQKRAQLGKSHLIGYLSEAICKRRCIHPTCLLDNKNRCCNRDSINIALASNDIDDPKSCSNKCNRIEHFLVRNFDSPVYQSIRRTETVGTHWIDQLTILSSTMTAAETNVRFRLIEKSMACF